MDVRSVRASRQPRINVVTAREVFPTVPSSVRQAVAMDNGSIADPDLLCLLLSAGGKVSEMMAGGAESALGGIGSAEAVQLPLTETRKCGIVYLAYSSLVPARNAPGGIIE